MSKGRITKEQLSDSLLSFITQNAGSGSGGPSTIEFKKNSVTVESSTNRVAIGISGFNKSSDLLMVYKNSVYLEESVVYTISSDNLYIQKIDGNWNETGTSVFNFVVIKGGASSSGGSNGIADGSITKAKLANELQNKIDEIDNLSQKDTELSSQLEQIKYFFTLRGYELDVTKLDTIEKVNNNWTILKSIIKNHPNFPFKFNTFLTLNRVYAEWISGRNCPIGFYSDSTTDGATTTGHVSNVGNDNPFKVTINESPNSYPSKLESYIKILHKSSTPVKCYNGGFDSQSYKNGFGLKHWYNTWFRGLSGSNVDYSDVKMIVLGFGTSDSINLNDTANVIDNYSIDLECTIIDCLLRGVQPVLQAPVFTTQKVGETVEYRNSNESITIIETIQKQLCRKYNLEYLSMREPLENILNNFSELKYGDFMNDVDMVHPIDMGHRLYASWLCTQLNPNIPFMKSGIDKLNLFAGHHSYITKFTDIISPTSKSGNILKKIDTTFKTLGSYIYNWSNTDGNKRNDGDFLLRIPIYCEKPTVLYYNNIDNNKIYNEGLQCIINNLTIEQSKTLNMYSETYKQPVPTYFTGVQFVALLPVGLNVIDVNVIGDYNEIKFGGFLLDDINNFNCEFGRATGSSELAIKTIDYPPINVPYTIKNTKEKNTLNKFYNSFDAQQVNICMTLTQNLNSSTTYKIYSHYNDIRNYKDSYNLVEITGDSVTIKTSNVGIENAIYSTTVSGLNAKLIKGSELKISYQSKNYNNEGVMFNLFIDNISQLSKQFAVNEVWSEGYGFNSPNIISNNIYSTSFVPILSQFDRKYLL